MTVTVSHTLSAFKSYFAAKKKTEIGYSIKYTFSEVPVNKADGHNQTKY